MNHCASVYVMYLYLHLLSYHCLMHVYCSLLAGTDEKAIISVVAYRSNAQRQQIKEKFKAMYGKVSQQEVDSGTCGSYTG